MTTALPTSREFTVGSLFSGIGGMDLGLEWAGMRIAWQVEANEFCRGVLRRHWPHATLYGDINDLDPTELAPVDLICGGFPCQPVSLAGRRQGHNDRRWLWPAMREVIRHVSPTWVLGENTPGLITMGLDGVLADLEALGYACRSFVVPACAVDAPHRRDRVFIVAHSDSGFGHARRAHHGWQTRREALSCHGGADDVAYASGSGLSPSEQPGEPGAPERGLRAGSTTGERSGACGPGAMEHAEGVGRGERRAESEIRSGGHAIAGTSFWRCHERITGADGKARRVKPGVRLLAHGVPGRVARLKATGNAVVPQVALEIGRAIIAANSMPLMAGAEG